jgi:high-affinity Fe2+/Pb2+ permease
MGIYPSVETLTAQGTLIVLLMFATIWTFWPRHKPEAEGPEA